METKLKAGTTLIVDRYSYSGVAFSSAKGLDIEWCKVKTWSRLFFFFYEPRLFLKKSTFSSLLLKSEVFFCRHQRLGCWHQTWFCTSTYSQRWVVGTIRLTVISYTSKTSVVLLACVSLSSTACFVLPFARSVKPAWELFYCTLRIFSTIFCLAFILRHAYLFFQ